MALRYLAAVASLFLATTTMTVHTQDVWLSYTMESFNGTRFLLNFTSTSLAEFNACLCKNSTQYCSLYYQQNGVVSSVVTTQFSLGYADPDLYTNAYMCSQINNNNNHIKCSRSTVTTCPSPSNCESFRIHDNNSVCQMGRANISWDPSRHVQVTYIDNQSITFTIGTCYECSSFQALSTTTLGTYSTTVGSTKFIDVASSPPRQYIESTTFKTVTSTALNAVNATIPGDKGDDNTTPVIVGVVVAVIVILALLIIIIVCHMRRKRQRPTRKSKEQSVSHTKTANSLKESVYQMDSHVYDQADGENTILKTVDSNANDSNTPHTFSGFTSASSNQSGSAKNKTSTARQSSAHVYEDMKDQDATQESGYEIPLQKVSSSLHNTNSNSSRDESSVKIAPAHVGFYSNTYDHPNREIDKPNPYTSLNAPNKDSSAKNAKPILNEGNHTTPHYFNAYDELDTEKGSTEDDHAYKALTIHNKGKTRNVIPDDKTSSVGNQGSAASEDYITPIDNPYNDIDLAT